MTEPTSEQPPLSLHWRRDDRGRLVLPEVDEEGKIHGMGRSIARVEHNLEESADSPDAWCWFATDEMEGFASSEIEAQYAAERCLRWPLATVGDPGEVINFCPSCFASTDNSSWGGEVFVGGCTNCGHGPPISMPRWAAEQIRKSASWVGRRYYPSDEDKEDQAERRALLDLVKEFPGRRAEPVDPLVPAVEWRVVQATAPGRVSYATFIAGSAEEAMEAARHSSLRYRPASTGR